MEIVKTSVVPRGEMLEREMNRQSPKDFYGSEDTRPGIIIQGFGKCHLYICQCHSARRVDGKAEI